MAMSLSWWVDVHIVQQDIVLLRNHGMDTESRTCFVVSAEHCNTTWSVTSVAAAYTQNLNPNVIIMIRLVCYTYVAVTT